MGYYTHFTLDISDVELIREAEKRFEIDLDGNNDAQWYEHEEDMIEFSKEHPDVLFPLYGKGEDWDDIWVKYFKNGKAQIEPTQIIYPECKL